MPATGDVSTASATLLLERGDLRVDGGDPGARGGDLFLARAGSQARERSAARARGRRAAARRAPPHRAASPHRRAACASRRSP